MLNEAEKKEKSKTKICREFEISNSIAHAGFRFDSDDEPDEIVASEDLAAVFDRVSSLTDSSNVPLSAYVDVDDCLLNSTSLNVL